jgi:hypothetical protein
VPQSPSRHPQPPDEVGTDEGVKRRVPFGLSEG